MSHEDDANGPPPVNDRDRDGPSGGRGGGGGGRSSPPSRRGRSRSFSPDNRRRTRSRSRSYSPERRRPARDRSYSPERGGGGRYRDGGGYGSGGGGGYDRRPPPSSSSYRGDYGPPPGRGDYGPPPGRYYDDRPPPRGDGYYPRGGGGGDFGGPPRDFGGPPPRDFGGPPRGPPRGGGGNRGGGGGGGNRRGGGGGGRGASQEEPGVSLLVRNVSPDITTQDLQRAFGRIGEIRDVYIPRDYHSQQPKGFAFIEYATADQAEEARDEMDRFVIKGRELEVVFAQEKRKTPNEMRGRVVNQQNRGRDRSNFERSSSFERHRQREQRDKGPDEPSRIKNEDDSGAPRTKEEPADRSQE